MAARKDEHSYIWGGSPEEGDNTLKMYPGWVRIPFALGHRSKCVHVAWLFKLELTNKTK